MFPIAGGSCRCATLRPSSRHPSPMDNAEALEIVSDFQRYLKTGEETHVRSYTASQLRMALARVSASDNNERWYKEMEARLKKLETDMHEAKNSQQPSINQTINIHHMESSHVTQHAVPTTTVVSNNLRVWNFITGRRGILFTLAAVAGIGMFALKSYDVAKEKRATAVPRVITLAVPRIGVQVGKMLGRIDDVVEVPANVSNSSGETAFNLVLDILFSDGTGRKASLNEYLQSVGGPPISLRLLPTDQSWNIPPQAISAPPNAKALYSSGEREFKVKLQLTWKDASNREHQVLELAKLRYLKEREGYPGVFWFDSIGSYSSERNQEDLRRHWGLGF